MAAKGQTQTTQTATVAADPLPETAATALDFFCFSAHSLLACLPLSAASARAFFNPSSFSRFSFSRVSLSFLSLLKASLPLLPAVAPLTLRDLLPGEDELAMDERRLALVFAAGDVVVAVAVRCFGMERDEENAFWPFSAATLERFNRGRDIPRVMPAILDLFALSGIILARLVLLVEVAVTVAERFRPPLLTFSFSLTGSTPVVLRRDLLAAGFASAGFLIVGRGLVSFFSAAAASILLRRSSLASFNLAATSSPGSLKIA